jgi:hypothetical protein
MNNLLTRKQVEYKFENMELDDEFAEFVMDLANQGEVLICNGNMLTEAMESGRYDEPFIDWYFHTQPES